MAVSTLRLSSSVCALSTFGFIDLTGLGRRIETIPPLKVDEVEAAISDLANEGIGRYSGGKPNLYGWVLAAIHRPTAYECTTLGPSISKTDVHQITAVGEEEVLAG